MASTLTVSTQVLSIICETEHLNKQEKFLAKLFTRVKAFPTSACRVGDFTLDFTVLLRVNYDLWFVQTFVISTLTINNEMMNIYTSIGNVLTYVCGLEH